MLDKYIYVGEVEYFPGEVQKMWQRKGKKVVKDKIWGKQYLKGMEFDRKF